MWQEIICRFKTEDTETHKPSAKTIEDIVLQHWEESSDDEARSIIEIMISTPSTRWLELMARAEAHGVRHWQMLLDRANQIYESAAEATANEDGLVIVEKEDG